MAIRTIFTMAEDCARGERLGWREFVRDYFHVADALLAHYFPTLRPELRAHVAGVFQRARSDDNAWFRGLRFANEREFLMAFRDLVFAYGRKEARLPAPAVSPESARELMHGLTVVERELFWMFVKGYEASQAASVLMNADSTAAAVRQIAEERLVRLVPGGVSEGALNVLIEAAERAGTPDCLPLKTVNNLINGQISWQDRDRAEQHLRDCLHCVDRFTSFQEMIWYRRQAQPLSDAEISSTLTALGFGASRKGLAARLFSKTA